MSTRCQIKLKGFEEQGGVSNIYVYKHFDGYPEEVVPQLFRFIKNFKEHRSCNDGPYLLCQLVRHFAVGEYQQNKELGYTGWGLDCVVHGDIQYLYEVDSSGNIYINGKKQKESKMEKMLVKYEKLN